MNGLEGTSSSAYGVNVLGTKTTRKSNLAGNKSNRAKKKLNYNHREISSMLLRANRSQSAAAVLSMAKSKLANVKKSGATGQYDRREVSNAAAHASRMVQCAELKVRHLREEEREHKKENKKNKVEHQQHKNERKSKINLRKRQRKEQLEQKHLHKLQQQKQKQQQLERKRRLHRDDEYGKITEANMKYQQGNSDSQEQQVQTFEVGDAIALYLGSETVFVDEQQIEKMAENDVGVNVDITVNITSVQSNISDVSVATNTGAASAGVDVVI